MADKPMVLLNVSEHNRRWNSIALSFVESAIPQAVLAQGVPLTVHHAGRDDQTLCDKPMDKLLHDDEYWSLAAADVTCPACRTAMLPLRRILF